MHTSYEFMGIVHSFSFIFIDSWDSSVTEVTFFAAPSEADRGAEEKHCSLAVKPGDRIKAALVPLWSRSTIYWSLHDLHVAIYNRSI